jgi:Flp pilus assembly protein TadD
MSRTVAAALMSLLAVPTLAQTVPGPAPPYLVVPFENASGEPRVYWLSEASASLLTDHLNALGALAIRREHRLRAFTRLRVPPVSALSHATVIRVGQVVGAASVVVGSFTLEGDALVVRARAIRLDMGQITPELVERGPLTDLLRIYGRVARRMLAEAPAASTEQMAQAYPSLAAFEQYIKGLLAEAPEAQIAFLSQALRLAPSFQRSRVALWEVHTGLGEHNKALGVIQQVPPTHAFGRQARFLAGVSMLHLGQHQAAFEAFTALHRESPDAAILNNLGVAQLRRADAAYPGGRAVSYLGEAVTLDGSDPDLFFNLGYAYWLDRDPQGAVYWLREAVRRNPADDAAHYVLGVALQASGNAAEAAREKELARRLSSTYAEWEAKQPGANVVPRGLERIKVDLDLPAALRIDAAVEAAGQRDQQAVADFHLERGRRLHDAGRDDEAIAELRRTVFLSPYDSDAHLLLGRIYLRMGRRDEAIEALTIAVWSDPDNMEAKTLIESIK